jgi:hypothetical protein
MDDASISLDQQVIPQVQRTKTSAWAVISLVSGILAWLGVCGLGGIAAVICGHIAKNEIHKNPTSLTGDGMATVGLILGYINIALAVMGICLALMVITGVISGAAICFPFLNDFNWSFTTTP